MELCSIKKNPQKALSYLERLVNDGSPSGFSEKCNTSLATNPFYSDGFELFRFEGGTIRQFGSLPKELEQYGVLAHPDWLQSEFKQIHVVRTGLKVVPTSSARTVRLKDFPYYIKMSYPGVIGRMYRKLEEQQIVSALEVSALFHQLSNSDNMPSSFAFYPENGGRLFLDGDFSTGYVVRDGKAVGKNVDKIHYIIPAFSLFSIDRGKKEDTPIIIQILQNKDAMKYLTEQIFLPLIDIYMTCSLSEGLNPEMHAQNVMLGLNSNDDVVSLILRDMESVDKDWTIRKQLNKQQFNNCYKVISETDYNYRIKHSFMFDHKLGEYLIQSIIDKVESYGLIDKKKIIKVLRAYTHEKYGDRLKDYFPQDGCWYRFEQIQIDRSKQSRPYVRLPNPILR